MRPNCVFPNVSVWSSAVSICVLLAGFSVSAGADVLINEFMTSNANGITDEDGDTSDWIELYNNGGSPVSLGGWSLSDSAGDPAQWVFPSVSIGAGQYLVVFASGKDRAPLSGELHTNFSLGQDGEYLGLFTPVSAPVAGSVFSPQYPAQQSDFSYGNPPGGPGTFVYYPTPTPGAANSGTNYAGLVSKPVFGVAHQLASAPFNLALTMNTPGGSIRYTTDGSEPSLASTLYTGPIPISGTTIIRAGGFRSEWLPSPVVTQSYIFLSDVITQQPTGAAPGPGWAPPGSSSTNGQNIVYGMDPDVVNDPDYSDDMITSLEAVPTMTIVTDLDNLWHATTGMYVNASGDGFEWERPASAELIYADGTPGFQINAGLRIRGGYSRGDFNPKHAFRLFFRSEYGEAKLNYPLFGDEGADEFDNIDLRTSQNYAWARENNDLNTMLREVWARDMQREMGHPYTRSRYYHLYLNGVYWGLFQTQERSEASYAETYFGGDKDNYDVMKPDRDQGYEVVATDGNDDAWDRLWIAASAGFETDEAYYKVQGLNTDGTPNLSYDVDVDLDNLIDYMIITYYGGNIDAPVSRFLGNNRTNNFFAIRDRTGREGWKFFQHDAEHTLLMYLLNEDRTGPFPAGDNVNDFNPQWLHQQLMGHPEYRMRFADRVHRHFFNDGLLMESNAVAQFLTRKAEIDMAIIAESARWGDTVSSTPRTKLDDWIPRINTLVNQYFGPRRTIVLDQFRNRNWYPNVEAPTVNQFGGPITPGFNVTLSAPTGTIYYTLNGADPRLPAEPGPVVETTLVSGTATKKILVPGSAGNLYTSPGSFAVFNYFANVTVNNISTDALKVINGTEYQSSVSYANANTVNYTNAGSGGHYVSDAAFPGTSIGVDADDFVVVAKGYVNIPASGTWTFGVLSDDGFRLRLTSGATSFQLLHDGTRGPGDSLQAFNIPAAGIYQIELIFFERGGGADLELFAAQGQHESWNSTDFDLVGDTANGGLALVNYWTFSGFADGSWTSGTGGAGFETGSGYDPYFNIDTESSMFGEQRSCLMRIPFTIGAGGLDGKTGLTLGVQYDDGFVAYLNGTQIAQRNAPGPILWNSFATSQHADEAAVIFEEFDVSEFRHLLKEGNNVLSLHGLNISASSTDFLLNGELKFIESSQTAGEVAPGAVTYGGTVTLNETTLLQARVLSGNTWSALLETTFGVGNPGDSLRIGEIMYNPATGGAEFIELVNVGGQTIDISGAYFSDGIEYTFPPNTVLLSGERLVLVSSEDIAAFGATYPGVQYFDEYEGRLANGGETVTIRSVTDVILDSVTYNDAAPWPTSADGQGFSLVLLDAGGDPNDAGSWRASTNTGGDPGSFVSAPGIPKVRINEALTHTDLPQVDSIEIWNASIVTADLRGWYLTDDRRTPKKAQIPNRAEFVIPSGGYAVITENDFAFSPGAGLPGFFLSSHGNEGVYIYSANGVGALTGYSHGYQTEAAENGVSFGSHFSSDGVEHFTQQAFLTLGAGNSDPQVGPIVISEIQYAPTSGVEYVELTNISGSSIPMWDNSQGGNPNNTYQVNGIGYIFPTGVVLPAGSKLLIVNSATPQDYGTPYGPFGNGASLDNSGETLTLEWPDKPDEGFVPYIAMDRVTYSPSAPWPNADGNGNVLRRISNGEFGNDPANWTAGAPEHTANPAAGHAGSVVYLDFAWTGTALGTFENPFRTIVEALHGVSPGGTIRIKSDSASTTTPWTGTITKHVILKSHPGGIIRIGVGAKSLKGLPENGGGGADALTKLLDALRWAGASAVADTAEDEEAAGGPAVFEPVIPYTRDAEGRYQAQADSALALRLRNAAGIDLNSLWQSMYPGEPAPVVEWRPAGEGSDDIWVVFSPEETWYLDDTLTATAGGTTLGGAPVSASGTFQIESPEAYDARHAAPQEILWQPELEEDPEASRASGLTSAHAVPGLASGAGAPVAITPERVFASPQRVWLPLPSGSGAGDVQLYYYHLRDAAWYPAEQVAGWLVPESTVVLDMDGARYLGFLVRHAGIVQLGAPAE